MKVNLKRKENSVDRVKKNKYSYTCIAEKYQQKMRNEKIKPLKSSFVGLVEGGSRNTG